MSIRRRTGYVVASALVGLVAGYLAAAPACADPLRLAPALSYLAAEAASDADSVSKHSRSPISLSLRFRDSLSDDRVCELEAMGIHLERAEGSIQHLGSIYRAQADPAGLARLADLADLEWAESVWRPGLVPCMDVSRAEVRAAAAWDVRGPDGHPLTGRGRLIADFDTGIDLYHPAFWFADGDTVAWVDVNRTHRFEAGIDGADFNGDGLVGPDEVLRFWDGKVEDAHGLVPNRLGEFEVDRDWLYRDLNGTGAREAGVAWAFSERDPTFGEPVFLVLDTNGDNTLDPGERLVALKTCKVRAVLDPGSKERRRGRDLILTERDALGHGTCVAGILAGERPGRLLAGVAPDAELLMADAFGGADLGQLILWALDEGADVMLYELANWVWDYMDGSSNVERMIDLAAAKGPVQLVAAGNLAGSAKHFRTEVTSGDPEEIRMRCPENEGTRVIWGSVLWRAPDHDLTIRIRSPGHTSVVLSGAGAQTSGGIRYWSHRGVSPRGTVGMFFSIEGGEGLGGIWEIEIQNPAGSVQVDGYVSDDRTSWSGGTIFLDALADRGTVTWPANADSAITVGSYASRNLGLEPGRLSRFSGQGPRLDGRSVVDLVAPGNVDIRTCQSGALPRAVTGTYTSFGGTSASAAHAAGVAALVLQANPALGHSGAKFVLCGSAVGDCFTGPVPNDRWGAGKVDALAAVAMALDIEVPETDETAVGDPRIVLAQNFPNPFNPLTTIRFQCDAPGPLTLGVYDVQGRRVRVLVDRYLSAGEWEVAWDGTDGWGRRVSSGVYFYRLEAGDLARSRKMLLLE